MTEIRAVATDRPEAHALLEEYFAHRAALFPGGGYRPVFPTPATFTEPAGVFVVLFDGEEAVGCGGIRRIAGGSVGSRFEVKHLFVRDSGRGRGWGRMLLNDLEQRASALGAAEIVLDTHHTLDAAGALYTRNGYTSIERYNDNPNATVWLGKSVTPRIRPTAGSDPARVVLEQLRRVVRHRGLRGGLTRRGETPHCPGE